MPFGHSSAAQNFQSVMHEVTRGLENIYLNLDDILLASHSEEQYSVHLCALLDRLSKQCVTIDASNYELGEPDFTFLRHIVSPAGIAPLLDNVTAIRDYSEPRSHRLSRQFLGLINFYLRFISNCAEIITPLQIF